ncbi:cellulase family glycosylhydrolase [Streptomyces sp. MP131-18]|uniref:cellulase family glycosylhydrolase n=1 Tax=Streptomyces sp. MP131-18 TaxID=1857892 RepID=UPI00097BB3FE|nr:cellulase family glycosylhydrolase [Streptomyces sp. MP131-18]ONK10225.1 Mannan endo-1,4-beta-mannosidase precursor [Streptomyces sp. MP131-18]
MRETRPHGGLRPRAGVALAALLSMLAALLGFGQSAQADQVAPAATGFRIDAGRLLEANGNDFVMRGVNHAHTWFTGETDSLAHIKALGANTVRVVLSSGHRWTRNDASDVSRIIGLCKQNRLICVLEVHDTTGYGEEGAAASLDQAADYWIGIQSALAGQEQYVILNIGNEPYGNSNTAGWTADTRAAVLKLRNAGFDHTIMVDAPNWGQDWSGTMRANARSVFDADPDRNVIFSVHMYGVYDTAAEIRDYLNAFVSAGLPILVGEFGHNHSDGNPDEDTILATAQSLGLGYLGWSWSGNGGGVEYLDMVTAFDPSRLTSWGQRIFNGANGIAQTSREAAVYGGQGGDDDEAPTAPGRPVASEVTATSVRLSWPAATDNVGVTGYDVVRVSGGGETAVASTAANAAAVSGLSPGTDYTFAVYARDAAGNRSDRSATVGVTTGTGGGTPSDCSVRYQVVGEWSNGFQGDIVIGNTGTAAISDWTLAFAFADGQRITNMWGGTATQSGGSVTVTPAPYTASIPAGGSVALGFTAEKGAGNAAPTEFTLSGGVCGTA